MNQEQIPLDDKGNQKKRFEVKMRTKNGTIEKAIFIDGELLDWSIDISSLMECKKMGPEYFRAAQRDIEKHFINSVSEVVGRKITVDQIKEATKNGWI